MIIIVTFLLCTDVNTTSSWCCVALTLFHGDAENCVRISVEAACEHSSGGVQSDKKIKQNNITIVVALLFSSFSSTFMTKTRVSLDFFFHPLEMIGHVF